MAGSADAQRSYKNGLIFFKDKIYTTSSSSVQQAIVSSIHAQCYEGYQITLHRIW